MGMQYQHGARRRRVLIVATQPLPPSPPVNPPARPPVVVATRPRGRAAFRTAIVVRAEFAPPLPPPPPSPPTPRLVVVPTVPIRFQGGNRRRRVTVVASVAPNNSPVISSAALRRVIVAPRFPARPRPPIAGVWIKATAVVSGGLPTPPPGGAGSPKPLQSSWIIGALRARFPRPVRQPIVVHQRFVPPTKDGFPNQIVVVAPHRPVRRPAAVIVRPEFKWGLNAGKTPNPPVVVPRPVGRRSPQAIVVSSPATQGLGFVPAARPVVVRPPRRIPTRAAAVVHGSMDARTRLRCQTLVAARPTPRRSATQAILASTAETFAVRPIQPARPIIIPAVKPFRRRGMLMVLGLLDAYELAPPQVARPIVVARPVARRTAKAIIVSLKPSVDSHAIPAFDPIVVSIPRSRKAAPWVFTSQFLKFTVPPPRHEPRPTPTFVRIPRRRSPLMWPNPQTRTSILQPDDDRIAKPPDLIAACIAWLRANPAIVSAFGDDAASSTSLKFTSDVEPPGVNLPYAVFDEPHEVESYETADHTGRPSSLAAGVFHLTAFASEKLAVRNLAETLAASLNDAPLVFVDGVLIYLRRSERRFPTVSATGPGANATMFKRVLEFEYLIERYI